MRVWTGLVMAVCLGVGCTQSEPLTEAQAMAMIQAAVNESHAPAFFSDWTIEIESMEVTDLGVVARVVVRATALKSADIGAPEGIERIFPRGRMFGRTEYVQKSRILFVRPPFGEWKISMIT